jgi:hypothetical protein
MIIYVYKNGLISLKKYENSDLLGEVRFKYLYGIPKELIYTSQES